MRAFLNTRSDFHMEKTVFHLKIVFAVTFSRLLQVTSFSNLIVFLKNIFLELFLI